MKDPGDLSASAGCGVVYLGVCLSRKSTLHSSDQFYRAERAMQALLQRGIIFVPEIISRNRMDSPGTLSGASSSWLFFSGLVCRIQPDSPS